MPLYDVLSAPPILGHGANQLALERACGIAEEVVQTLIDDLVMSTPEVIARVNAVLPTTFPAQVADAVFAGMRAAATKLTAAL